MYLWIAIGAVVALVVAGFLFAIANSLEEVDQGLEEASEAVRLTEGDVRPLPSYIEDINVSLARVDAAVDPLPRRAGQVIDNLQSIDSTLGSVEGALNSTEGVLNTTEARLNDTERTLNVILATLNDTVEVLVDTEGELDSALGDLVTILSLAERIDRELEAAQEFDSLGTNGIWRRVRFLNGGILIGDRENDSGLLEVRDDTESIIDGLQQVNKHLESTCMVIPDLTPSRPQQPPPGGGPLPIPIPGEPQAGGRTSAQAAAVTVALDLPVPRLPQLGPEPPPAGQPQAAPKQALPLPGPDLELPPVPGLEPLLPPGDDEQPPPQDEESPSEDAPQEGSGGQDPPDGGQQQPPPEDDGEVPGGPGDTRPC